MEEVNETSGVNEKNEINEISEVNEAGEAAEMEETQQTDGIYPNLASRWRRLGGSIIDGVIASIIGFIFMVKMGVFKKIMNGMQMTITETIYLFIIAWVAFLIIQGYLLYKRGQTVGKILVNTKIVDLHGNIPNFGKLIFLRYFIFGLIGQIPFVGGLFGLADALFIFGEDKRCLHDHLAGTIVVNESNI